MQKIPLSVSPTQLSEWIQTSSKEIFLVDVREENEISFAPFPLPIINLPLSKSSDWINDIFNILPKEKPIVVICHAGIRSWNFCEWLISRKLEYEVWNLDGGIDAWSVQIDPSIPRY